MEFHLNIDMLAYIISNWTAAKFSSTMSHNRNMLKNIPKSFFYVYLSFLLFLAETLIFFMRINKLGYWKTKSSEERDIFSLNFF
jgi:hypothetical protein